MNPWMICLLMLLLANTVSATELPPLEGLIEPGELVEFSSQMPGIIEKITVRRGSHVRQGQVLVQLKSGVEKATVKLAEARVEFNRRKAKRSYELFKRELISAHDKDELETEIQLAELELDLARERLALRTIISTIDGVVVDLTGTAGEYVGEEPFLTIAKIDPLHVELVVPVQFFGAIKVGAQVQVHLGQPVGGSYRATVVIVDQVIDATSGTFRVRLKLPNPKLELPAGLRCKVIF